MGLRGVASQLARASSGIWQGVADAIDPPTRSPAPADSAPATPPAGPSDVEKPPEGAMLVPLDTWTRILEQIGNVHEAGQQLAEARERAARAETENEFLRAQLADLKAKKRPVATTEDEPRSQQSPTRPRPDVPTETRTARRVRQARERAGKWISPGK